jgi:hypothetical protein
MGARDRPLHQNTTKLACLLTAGAVLLVTLAAVVVSYNVQAA